MKRPCNCNFATSSPAVTLVHAAKSHLFGKNMAVSSGGQSATIGTMDNVVIEGQTPNSLWWHSLYEPLFRDNWPVCWPKNGPMSLWFNRDGWVALYVDTCKQKRFDSWKWVLTAKGADGQHDAVIQDAQVGGLNTQVPIGTPMMDALKLDDKTPDVYVYIDGVGYVIVLATATSHYSDYSQYHNPYYNDHGGYPPGYENHHENDPDKHPTWCGLNPNYPFIVPPGTKITNVPNPTGAYMNGTEFDTGTQCFVPTLRCTRLFLVQNAAFNDDGTIDFSNATAEMLGHDGQKKHKLRGKDRRNGIRPLHYKRGVGTAHRIVDHKVRGKWSMDDFYFPPIENAADPIARSENPNPIYTKSPVFAPFTTREGIRHPDAAPTYEEDELGADGDPILFRPDWPDKWPAYVWASPRYNKEKGETEWRHHARFWRYEPTDLNDDLARIKTALENTPRGLELWGKENKVDPEDPDSESTYELPFPSGTAFDMVVAVRTWYANRYIGALESSGQHESSSGIVYDNEVYKWVEAGRVYLNSQVSGYIYQLSPTRPRAPKQQLEEAEEQEWQEGV